MVLPEALALYESWSLTRPTRTPPSRLYCLAPVNLGTSDSESLTSYIARLAQAHNVTVSALFGREIAPLVERTFLKRRMAAAEIRAPLISSFRDLVRAANGIGRTATDLTRAVETLTLRSDIRLLTMKPWANVFAKCRLLRLTHAACFACYEQWRMEGKVVCDPLLWALQAVTICPKHARPLDLQCSCCRLPLWPLTSHSRPGHCSKCGEWLGTFAQPASSGRVTLTDGDWNQAVWMANAAGELIAAAPALTCLPVRESVAQAIAAQTGRFGGKRAPLARLLQANRGTLGDWQRGEQVPEFGRFLKMCFHLNLSPLSLLIGCSAQDEAPRIPARTQPIERKASSANRPGRLADLKQFHDSLHAALQEYPPPTFKEVARRLNRRPATILHHFPDQYRTLVARHARYQKSCAQDRWNRAKLGLEAALREQPPPSTKELGKRLGCSLPALQQHHPSLYQALWKRHTCFLKHQTICDLRSKLKAALNEYPPPAFKTLARRFGYARATVLKYCPDLVRLIIKHCARHRQATCLMRRQQLEDQIRRVALALHQSGTYPSLRKVSSQVTQTRTIVGNERATVLLRSIREELDLRGARQAVSSSRLES